MDGKRYAGRIYEKSIGSGVEKMKTVKVGKIEIGAGKPKICVPIVGKTLEEIKAEAKSVKEAEADMVEWRADWFLDVSDSEKVIGVLKNLREILGETPLLFTFRRCV